MKKITVLLIPLFFFYGCVHMEIQRRENFIENNPHLSEKIKKTILEGKIHMGMTKDQVIASWGKPCEVNKSVGYWGTHEQWVYSPACYDYTIGKQTYLYFENGILTSWQE